MSNLFKLQKRCKDIKANCDIAFNCEDDLPVSITINVNDYYAFPDGTEDYTGEYFKTANEAFKSAFLYLDRTEKLYLNHRSK